MVNMRTLVYVIVVLAVLATSCYALSAKQHAQRDILSSQQSNSLRVKRDTACPVGFACCLAGYYFCSPAIFYYTTTTGPTNAGALRCSIGGTSATLFYYSGGYGTGCSRLNNTVYHYDGLLGRPISTGTIGGTLTGTYYLYDSAGRLTGNLTTTGIGSGTSTGTLTGSTVG